MPEQPFTLSGQLDTQAVSTAWRVSRSALAAGQLPEQIDLGNISQSDSATLALLLDWQAQAHSRNQAIRFINPPESLLVLARLSSVQDLLGWETVENPSPDAGDQS